MFSGGRRRIVLVLWTLIAFSLPSIAQGSSGGLSGPGTGPSKKDADAQAQQMRAHEVPTFQVDPYWPRIPNNWVFGEVTAINVDAQDHVWVLQRQDNIKYETGRIAPPPVLEFDSEGNFLQAWGGPGDGYEWPWGGEHSISIDHKGYVWISGSGTRHEDGNNQILKFTKDGKCVLQIGRAGQSKGNTDRNNMDGPAYADVYSKTNEVFVADGYFNRRVIVFDADTGAFKRMWGAFGNLPTDPPPSVVVKGSQGEGTVVLPATQASIPLELDEEGPGPQQFSNLHSLRVSNDGLVYVADKANRRIQIFTIEGKYVTQLFISRGKLPPSTLPGMAFGKRRRDIANAYAKFPTSVNSMTFSADPEQRFMYVADRRRGQVLIYDRKALVYLGAIGDGPGTAPGQFSTIHDLAVDSKGNLYTTEVEVPGNNRVQKFVFKGMSRVSMP